jgi:hypothetical protein
MIDILNAMFGLKYKKAQIILKEKIECYMYILEIQEKG